MAGKKGLYGVSDKDRRTVQHYVAWIEEHGLTAAAVRLVGRRHQVHNLKRKYRDTIESLQIVVAQRDEARTEVDELRDLLDDLLADQPVEVDGSYAYESARRAERYLEVTG